MRKEVHKTGKAKHFDVASKIIFHFNKIPRKTGVSNQLKAFLLLNSFLLDCIKIREY